MKRLKRKLNRLLILAMAAVMFGTNFYTADLSVRAQEVPAISETKAPCHSAGESCIDWFGSSMVATIDDVYQAALDKAFAEAITYAGMTDVQKARALHDYLAQHVEYDYTYTNYGGNHALLEGTAVCQGYATAYRDLLDMAGIENTYALSDSMNHIWNLVKIDGSWYHVDVTWDDPSVNYELEIQHDLAGKVYYNNFLVSDDEIAAQGHYDWYTIEGTGEITCTSKKYESAWWQNGVSAIFCIDGKEYYLSQPLGKTDIQLMCRTGNSEQILYTKNCRWNVWGESNSYWSSNYSGLSYYDGKLYFNDTTKVYCITPGTTTPTIVYNDKENKGYIYGSLVCDGKIHMSIWQNPWDGTAVTVVNLPGTTLEEGTIANVGYETSYIYSAEAIPAPRVTEFSTNAGLLNFVWYQNEVELAGPPTEPGTYKLCVSAAATATATAVEKEFAIIIHKRPITIAPKKTTLVYGEDKLPGTAIEDRFNVTDLLPIHEIGDITYSIDPLTAGPSTVTILGVSLQNADSLEDVTGRYDITYLPETITITKRPITLTASPQTIMYGSQIDEEKVSITTGTLAHGDWIEYTVEADTTTPTNNGVITITNVKVVNAQGQEVTSSYDIAKESGKLVIIPPHTHSLSDWYILEKPTCTKEGNKLRGCVSCDYTEEQAIPMLDHIWNADYTVDVAPSYEKEGSKSIHCSVCDGVKEGSLVTIPKLERVELENPFEDNLESEFYYDPVIWAYYSGITTGTSPTTFEPMASCTRGQVVTFLWRTVGKPAYNLTSNPFSDVNPTDPDAFYCDAVFWAVENGVTTGFPGGIFGPDQTVSRAQFVTFLWRAAGKPEATIESNPFSDVNEGEFYYDAVLWAAENGITTGYPGGIFGIDDPCTRGQVVTFLYRAYEK